MKKAACIIQARTGSTRLPGKVLKHLNGKSILSHIIDRIKKCNMIEDIIIATTELEKDDVIERLANENRVLCFRGHEEDVLTRYVGASKLTNCDILVRITSDCPLIDPEIVDNTVRYFINNNYDYITAKCENGIIRGLDTEVFTKSVLYKTDLLAKDKSSREHVTLYMYSHPNEFKVGKCLVDNLFDHPDWRLCVDQQEDFKLIEILYKKFYKKGEIIDMKKVVKYLQENSELLKININVIQKMV